MSRLDGIYQSTTKIDEEEGEEYWDYLLFRDSGEVVSVRTVSIPRLAPRITRDFGLFLGHEVLHGRQVSEGIMWPVFVIFSNP